MASRDDLYGLIGRAVANPEFAKKVVEDPVAAAKGAGVELTTDQKAWLSENPVQWTNFVGMISRSESVGALNCGTCLVDGH